MSRKRTVLLFVLLLLAVSAGDGAYLRSVPVDIKQPDGSVLRCFASGDEFYNWVHDEKGFTIIREKTSRYLVYAMSVRGKLVSSGYAVGTVDPELMNLQPNVTISSEVYQQQRAAFEDNAAPVAAPTIGTMNNLCVFIRFSDQTEFPNPRSDYDEMFNSTTTGDNSMRNYYDEASYGQLTISTSSYPSCASTTNLSYQDSHARSYYLAHDPVDNPDGYDGDDERKVREHTLIRDAVDEIESQVSTGLNIDSDADGYVDAITFIIRGNVAEWSHLLWPHQWQLSTYDVRVNGKRVYEYAFDIDDTFDVGVACHEMFHVLGAPDLYHYSDDGLRPVWTWDIMEFDQDPPQHMGAYMKYRYGHWISQSTWLDAEITPSTLTGGECTLDPLASSTNCFRWINVFPPDPADDEYFVLEYRRGNGTFDDSLWGEGLLIYRIKHSLAGDGNADGPPDEVYIYRPGGTPTTNGTPNQANFSSDVGRFHLNEGTDPSALYVDGTESGLFVADIGPVGNTVSFYVGWPTMIGGIVYDGYKGPLEIFDNPYWAQSRIEVPSGRTLNVDSGAYEGVRVYFDPGMALRSFGTTIFDSGQWNRFLTNGRYSTGLKSRCPVVIRNGGVIKFY